MPSTIPAPKPLPEGYTMIEGPPPLESYLHLRQTTGLSPKTSMQATKALAGSWYTIHITQIPSPPPSSTPPPAQVVAMSRIISDGGWYFHIADMAVDPSHQRKGLGDHMMSVLLGKIERDAPEGGPYVNLISDPPARKLYARHGFVETAGTPRGSVGMERRF